jgi:hypothetical protein
MRKLYDFAAFFPDDWLTRKSKPRRGWSTDGGHEDAAGGCREAEGLVHLQVSLLGPAPLFNLRDPVSASSNDKQLRIALPNSS